MDLEKGMAFYKKAIKEQAEEKLFQRWVNGYQHMMSFTEFKSGLDAEQPNRKEQNEEEILKKVKEILEGE